MWRGGGRKRIEVKYGEGEGGAVGMKRILSGDRRNKMLLRVGKVGLEEQSRKEIALQTKRVGGRDVDRSTRSREKKKGNE